MKYFIVFCFAIAFTLQASAQKIRGVVVDAQTQAPVVGASIRVKGSKLGTSTDLSGKFMLAHTNKADSLMVSCTGYGTCCIRCDSSLSVQLKPVIAGLEEVVVTAGRQEQPRKDIPAAISKISSNTIREAHATAPYQLLNKVAGVYMVNLGNEQHTMAIRQPITYNALYLYMEDGIPIRPTGIFNHNALYEINTDGIRDIEVIKGPASSLYGSNSIGAAVNFNTAKESVTPAGQIDVQGDKYHYLRAGIQGGLTAGKVGFYMAGYATHQEKGWQDYTDFDKYSLSAKVSYPLGADSKLTVYGTYNYLNTQTPGNLDSARFYNRSYSSNQRFAYRRVNAFRASSRLDHNWNDDNHTFLTLFYRNNSAGQLPSYYISDVRNNKGQYIKSTGQLNELSFYSFGLLAQHTVKLNFMHSQLIAGIYLDNSPSSFYANFLNIKKDNTAQYYTGYINTDSLIDNYKIHLFNAASYVQYMAEPVKRIKITTGLRYDLLVYNFDNQLPPLKTKYKQQEHNRYDVLAPKLGVTYDLQKGRGIYANFSMGFQPPETNTLYNSRQLTPLKQATYNNYELGGWTSLFSQKIRFELTAYYLQGKDEIISLLQADNTTQYANAAATTHKGLEYNLLVGSVKSLAFRIGGTFASHIFNKYSEISGGKSIGYDGHQMTNAPKWIANSEITWKPAFIAGFRTGVEWQHLGKYFTNAANTKTYSGYDLFNLRTAYRISSGSAKGLEVWFNVMNLTNKLYATTVTGNSYGDTYTAAPPRTLSLGISHSVSKL